MAAPGKYQVRFTIDGKPYTQAFEVMKDPAIATSIEDLTLSTQTQVRIRDDITATSEMVNRMEAWRKQIEDQLKANAARANVVKALNDLNKAMLDVELKLVSRSEMLSDDKYFPEAYKVYMNLIWLSGGVGMGASDEAGSIDYRPTETQMQVLRGDRKGSRGREGRLRPSTVEHSAGVQQGDVGEGSGDRDVGPPRQLGPARTEFRAPWQNRTCARPRAQYERTRRPAPLHAPGNRSRLVLSGPAATTDAFGRHMIGALMRRWSSALRGSQ